MRWQRVALVCVLIAVPAIAQNEARPDSFWVQRIYRQVDKINDSVNQVRQGQNELRQKLIEDKYSQTRQIDQLKSRIASNEATLQQADLRRQTRSERVWDWLLRTVPPLVVMLISFFSYEWYKSTRKRSE